tara:strand:- start:1203 stop:2003 length:801 start_codon:yes stop_codon:yes gene_type:complete
MSNLEVFCITNKKIKNLEKLNLKLVGVGKDDFPENYINTKIGQNIQNKEKFYSELVFHYWFWKNQLCKYEDNIWIGFCQKRRFWVRRNIDIKNFEQLKENILYEIPKDWENYEVILCNPIKVNNAKKMKMLKRGWRNLLVEPSIFFDISKQNIKLQFDMFHGYGILDKAIELLDYEEVEDFKKYVNSKTEFSPNIMFITKKKIMLRYFESVFKWLIKCEKIFGFEKLKGYETGRLYAYLAERYLSYWFEKHYKVKYSPWIFFDKYD